MSKKQINILFQITKAKYLTGKGVGGGSAYGLRQKNRSLFKENPDDYMPYLLDILDAKSDATWESEPRPVGLDLFSYKGNPFQSTFTIHDPKKPGKFRKVINTKAVVGHVGADAEITSRKAIEASSAAHDKRLLFEALMKDALMKGGDAATPLVDLADKKVKRKEPTE